MDIKKKILDLLQAGKSVEDIAAFVASEAKEQDGKSLLIQAMNEYEIIKGAKAVEAELKQKQAEELKKKQLDEVVEARVKEALKGVKTVNPIFAGEGVTKDQSWKEKSLGMIRAYCNKDFETARGYSDMFASAYKTKATLRGDSTTNYGFTVPEEWDAELHKITTDSFQILNEVVEYQTSGDTLNVQSTTIPSVSWVANQDTQYTESSPTSAQSQLVLRDLTARTNIANDLLEDSAANVIDQLTQIFGEAIGRQLEQDYLAGNTSAPDSDPFAGIYFTSGINSVASATGALSYADLISVLKQMRGRAVSGAAWMMNFNVLMACAGIVGTDGQPVLKQDMATGMPKYLLGFPVLVTDNLPSTFNAGTDRSTGTSSAILFGNIKKYLRVATKGSLRIALSEHVRFDYNQVQMRVLKRSAFAVPSNVASGFCRLINFSI